jgi:hypothetical protein
VDVNVAAGELVVTHPTPRPQPPPAALPRLAVDPLTTRVTVHPFSPVVVYAAIVATAASVVFPVVEYNKASSVYDTYVSSSLPPNLRNSAVAGYPAAKNVAYESLALPISLGAITGGLTIVYFAATKQKNVSLSLGPTPGGCSGTVRGVF